MMKSPGLSIIAITFLICGCLLVSPHALVYTEVSCVNNCTCRVIDSVVVEADCSNRGWYSVPSTLPYSLQSLDLSENRITDISGTILPKLKNLRYLRITSNFITTLAGVFSDQVDEFNFSDDAVLVFDSQKKKTFPPMLVSEDSVSANITTGYEHQVDPNRHINGQNNPEHSNISHDALSTEKPFKRLQQLFLGKNLISFIANDSFNGLPELRILDLSYNYINILCTHSFRGLGNIRLLNLKNNSLRMFPDTYPELVFSDLPKLEELNLQTNLLFTGDMTQSVHGGIQQYPDKALSYLTSLRRLHIDGLPMDQIPGPGFRKLTNLTLLDFGNNPDCYCYLNGLPEFFFSNITTKQPLEVLLTACRITYVHPKSFASLPTLTSLYLNHCDNIEFGNFSVFSQSFLQTQIKKLDITFIHRDTFILMLKAEWFQHLQKTKLESLIVEDNAILVVDVRLPSILPKTIKNFSLAKNKIIRANFLKAMPLMMNLEIFNISMQIRNTYNYVSLLYNGRAERLESHYGVKDANRKIISVKKCQSENSQAGVRKSSLSRPDCPGSDSLCRNQKSLSFEKKKGSYPYDDMSVQDLRELQKTFCPSFSVAFPSSVYGPGNLQIKMSHPNSLDQMYKMINTSNSTGKPLEDPFTQEFFNGILRLPQKVKVLKGSELKITYSIPLLEFYPSNVLELLDLSKNALWCFEGPIKGLHKLRVFDLSGNHAIALSPYFFNDMPALQKLHLSLNSLGYSLAADTSGATFSRLTSLEHLGMSNTDIRGLSGNIFLKTTRLETLDLSHNTLDEFSPELGHLVNLSHLDLSTNVLPRLSHKNMLSLEKIFSLNGKIAVDLSYNPLVCDCTTLDFLKWFQNTNVTFLNKDSYTCKYINGSIVRLDKESPSYKTLWRMCMGPSIFVASLVMFALVVVSWTSFSIYIYYRLHFLFYFYISKARYFLNFSQPELHGIKDVFIVYDDQEPKWRRFVLKVVKPALELREASCHITEIDSLAGRTNRMVIEESVLAGKKTLVLLTEDIFMFEDREVEINMAKLAEDMRQTKVLLFLAVEHVAEENIPPHVRSYLEEYMPLVYGGDNPEFWDYLVDVIKRE